MLCSPDELVKLFKLPLYNRGSRDPRRRPLNNKASRWNQMISEVPSKLSFLDCKSFMNTAVYA